MNDAKARLIDGLKKAIESEADGYQFYTMASTTTTDPKGRETFRTLAQEELSHIRFLKAQYSSIMDTGTVDPQVKLGTPQDFAAHGPIFSDDLVRRLDKAQFEMSALSIGMQLELSAIQFYKSQADDASDPGVRKFFSELAAWETGHYNALRRQQESLKEDFWASGGFAPF